MGRDVVADINCIWQTAFPKIITIAKEEGIENHNISDMIAGLPMDIPNGKLIFMCACVCVCMCTCVHVLLTHNNSLACGQKF